MLLFSEAGFKDHSTQGNLLKRTLLNEKQSSLEKEMYENISLYSQYFSPGAESNVHKTYFYFLKLAKILFHLIDYLNKISIKTNVATDEGNSRNEM